MKFSLPIVWKLLPYIVGEYYTLTNQVKCAETPEEKKAVFRFRYQACHEGEDIDYLKNIEAYIDEKNKEIQDDEDFKSDTLILYFGHLNNIQGTMRIAQWDVEKLPDDFLKMHKVDKLHLKKNMKTVGTINYFIFSPASRKKSTIALALLHKGYKTYASKQLYPPEIVFGQTYPLFYRSFHFKIGAFLYTKQWLDHAKSGILILWAYPPFDLTYFKAIQGPFYLIAKRTSKKLQKAFSNKEPLSRHITQHFRQEKLIVSSKEDLYQIIKPKEKSVTEFVNILLGTPGFENYFILYLEQGKQLITKNFIGKSMYLILEGTVTLFYENKRVMRLDAGNIVGEMSFLMKTNTRMTSVTAETEGKVLIISHNIIHRLKRKNPDLAIRFLLHLSRQLSEKFLYIMKTKEQS